MSKIPDSEFDRWGEPAVILHDRFGCRWFLANDMARSLGYAQYKIAIRKNVAPVNLVRFKDLKKCVDKNINGIGDDWKFLSEKGLYDFIQIASVKKKIAKQLKEKYLE